MAREATTPEQRAQRRANDYTGLLWHIATFIIVNAFLWTIDILGGGGSWAFWITLFWGIALVFHIASYAIDVSGRRRSLPQVPRRRGAVRSPLTG